MNVSSFNQLAKIKIEELPEAKMDFGKFKGRYLWDVPRRYFDWCFENMNDHEVSRNVFVYIMMNLSNAKKHHEKSQEDNFKENVIKEYYELFTASVEDLSKKTLGLQFVAQYDKYCWDIPDDFLIKIVGRKYNLEMLQEKIVKARELHFKIEKPVNVKVNIEEEISEKIKDIFPWDKLFTHQKDFLKFSYNKDSFGLYSPVGTGKSLMILLYHFLYGRDESILIVCRKTIFPTWINHIIGFYGKIISSKIMVVNGSRLKKIQSLENVFCKFFIINYESFVSPSITEAIIHKGFDFILLDESHHIKNLQAIRTKSIIKLTRNIKHKITMSGTYITGCEKDAFTQVYAVDQGKTFGKSISLFEKYYFKDNGFYGKEKMDDFYNKMAKIVFSVKKIEKTKPIHKNIFVEDEKVEELYHKVISEAIVKIKDVTLDVTYKLAELTRLRQLSGGHLQKFLISPYKAIALVETILEINKPVCVVANYTNEINLISSFLNEKKIKHFIISGQSKVDISKEIEKMKLGENRVAILQPQAASEGIDGFQYCTNYMLFYSVDFSWAMREQVKGRIDRSGQKETCIFIDFIFKLQNGGDSIDELIQSVLYNKRRKVTGLLQAIIGIQEKEKNL